MAHIPPDVKGLTAHRALIALLALFCGRAHEDVTQDTCSGITPARVRREPSGQQRQVMPEHPNAESVYSGTYRDSPCCRTSLYAT